MSEVQRVCEAMVTNRSQGVKQLEEKLSTTFSANWGALTARIREVEYQLKVRSAEHRSQLTVDLVLELVEEAAKNMKEHIERSLELGFKLARDELKQELVSVASPVSEKPLLEAVKKLVLDETTKAERRIGVQVQCAMTMQQAEINLSTQRQADATSILRDQLQQVYANSTNVSRQNDEAILHEQIAELVRNEAAKQIEALQVQIKHESHVDQVPELKNSIKIEENGDADPKTLGPANSLILTSEQASTQNISAAIR
ncbi:hypothetical protein V7S43_000910 [Phytophthora oleae]|uniref:Uncharacterized protein n=1 Tax=Phytophthora oleae TaxID=2107226 RepID=A0ABD3G731_9STRA